MGLVQRLIIKSPLMKILAGERVRIRAIINESRRECYTHIIFKAVKFIKKGNKINSGEVGI